MKNKCCLIFCLAAVMQTVHGMENPWLENLMVPLWMHLIQNPPQPAQQPGISVSEKKYQNSPQKQHRVKRTQQPPMKSRRDRIQQPK